MSMLRNLREAFVEDEFVCDIMKGYCLHSGECVIASFVLVGAFTRSKPAVASLSARFLRDHQRACSSLLIYRFCGV